MNRNRPESRSAITAACCFALLLCLLIAYVAGYLSCVQTVNGGHLAFRRPWQAILFLPAVQIEYAITGEPESPASSGAVR